MSNRHVRELIDLYTALSKDALSVYPQFEVAFQRDLARLERHCQKRGVAVFTVDLPAIGKHLDRCLSEGRFTLCGLPLSGRSSTRRVFPKYLGELLRLVFDDDGLLKEDDCDIEAIVFLRQFLYCAKKTELPCSVAANMQEIADFVSIDDSLPVPEKVWEEEKVKAADMTSVYRGFSTTTSTMIPRLIDSGMIKSQARLLAENLDIVSRFVATTLGSYDPFKWRFRHGPGAIAEKTGPVNKYHWSNWSNRLEERYPIADVGFYNYASWVNSTFSKVATLGLEIADREPHSRLVAVPKSFLKPRLIAAEPSENQWCQQNLWHYFQKRVGRTWMGQFISFRDQKVRNQTLCREGSVSGDLITVDLSSASDRVTPQVVGQTLRLNPELLCYLQAVRTRFLKQDINPDVRQEIELRKFSTMGSACTFPIESIVFLAITLASCITAEGRKAKMKDIRRLMGKVAVFGDDIIAPKDCWEFLQMALSALHFKVNHSKTFVTGRFRESCGIDAFRGVDVTPIYWKGICGDKPESMDSSIAVSNNFLQKRFFLHAARRIQMAVPCSFATVYVDSGVVGYKTFCRVPTSAYKTRWNAALQRTEAQVRTITRPSVKLPADDDSGLLQFFTEQPSPLDQWTHGVPLKTFAKVRKSWIPVHELQAPPLEG